MASKHIYTQYAFSPYSVEIGGNMVMPALSLGAVPDPRFEDRSRPTGERGSGPYFHCIKRPEDGLSHWYEKDGVCYADRCDHDTQFITKGTQPYQYQERRYIYSTPGAYLSLYYERYDETSAYGSKETCWVRGLYVERVLSDSAYPRAYGLAVWSDITQRGALLGFDYYLADAKRRLQEAVSTPCELLGRMVELVDLTSQGYENEHVAQVTPIRYKYNERDCFDWWTLTGALTHHCTSLASAAYIDAAENLPGATCNSIANVIEAMGSISDLFHGKPPKTPKDIKDLWLSYRYAVCTTKADIDEYSTTTRRLMELANASMIKSNGHADDGNIRCTATISVDPSACIPRSAVDWLRSYGFRLSALNAWDMVPYSFVVDWFLHIGDILESFQSYGDAIALPVHDIWYSFRTKYEGQDTYFRVPGEVYFALPYISYKQTSKKTVYKRILDAIALFT